MSEFSTDRRGLLRGFVGAGGAALLPGAAAGEAPPERPSTDPHTLATYAAAMDAVIPGEDAEGTETPGALAIDLQEYLVTYLNDLFSTVGPAADRRGDLRLAELMAKLLDVAAAELLARGENEDTPDPTRFPRAGLFGKLSREDRLHALALFDEKRVDTAELPGPAVGVDGGLVAQLVVAFPEVLYYGEWQGYEDFTAPPSEREFTNDPSAVQSWRQTEFPGFADGYAAFRGYWGAPDSSLGDGRVHDRYDGGAGGPRTLTMESGHFRENEYDTSDYEEVYPETDSAGGDGLVGDAAYAVTGEDDTEDRVLDRIPEGSEGGIF